MAGVRGIVAIIYLLLGLPFVRLARWAEERLARVSNMVRVEKESTEELIASKDGVL